LRRSREICIDEEKEREKSVFHQEKKKGWENPRFFCASDWRELRSADARGKRKREISGEFHVRGRTVEEVKV
jgi:hypothetical protein